VDPEVHLPRRADPLAADHRRGRRRAHRVAAQRGTALRRALRRNPASLAERVRRALARICGLDFGFDDTFRRLWEFYLAYSEAGFASGYLDVAQLQLVKRTR
jgi:cyclopropane fatty-acyl-phospholipid synthase-like methyltransferase